MKKQICYSQFVHLNAQIMVQPAAQMPSKRGIERYQLSHRYTGWINLRYDAIWPVQFHSKPSYSNSNLQFQIQIKNKCEKTHNRVKNIIEI